MDITTGSLAESHGFSAYDPIETVRRHCIGSCNVTEPIQIPFIYSPWPNKRPREVCSYVLQTTLGLYLLCLYDFRRLINAREPRAKSAIVAGSGIGPAA